jgi:hypothetical protein
VLGEITSGFLGQLDPEDEDVTILRIFSKQHLPETERNFLEDLNFCNKLINKSLQSLQECCVAFHPLHKACDYKLH